MIKLKNILFLISITTLNLFSYEIEFKNETLEKVSVHVWCANVSDILSLGFKTANQIISSTLNTAFNLNINPAVAQQLYSSIEKLAASEEIEEIALNTFDLITQAQKLKDEKARLEKKMLEVEKGGDRVLVKRLYGELKDIGKNYERINKLILDGKEIIDTFSNYNMQTTAHTQSIYALQDMIDILRSRLSKIENVAQTEEIQKEKIELQNSIFQLTNAINELQNSVVLVGDVSYLKYGAAFPKKSAKLNCNGNIDVIQTPMIKIEGKTMPKGSCFYGDTFKYGGARNYTGDTALKILGFSRDLTSRKHRVWIPGLYPIIQEGNNPPHIFNRQGNCGFN